MSKVQNSIGWCDDTGNKVVGCDKVSPGCKNCYAEKGMFARIQRAMGHESWGPKGERIPIGDFAAKLRRLNKLCVCDTCAETQPFARVGQECGMLPSGQTLADNECRGRLRRIRFFADSNSDWLDEKWGTATRAEFLKEIHAAPNVDVLLLTKRIERFETHIRAIMDEIESTSEWKADKPIKWMSDLRDWLADWYVLRKAPKNIWLGVSVENQKYADLRISLLLNIPAVVRFISAEPLLEKVDLKNITDASRFPGAASFDVANGRMIHHDDDDRWPVAEKLDWVIIGGESGKERRDCGVEAVVGVAQQCMEAEVPVYVKQDCAFKSGQQGRIPDAIWNLKKFPKFI